jgi:hypothetical protein
MNKEELITLRENDPVKYAVKRCDEATQNFVMLSARTYADFQEVFRRLERLEAMVADLMKKEAAK